MADLKILDIYNKASDSRINEFNKKIKSTLEIVDNYEANDSDTEWLDMMEDTIKYIDNILRNPNRFIINEEDIVKVELARRVTVESIKHLSRNTNLIQDYDKKTGDVKPSKILNINKEESYNTYENRFIYSLIQNMKSFIARKKSLGISDSSVKSNKKLDYNASVKLGDENVSMTFSLDSKIDSAPKKEETSIGERIEKLELQISDLTNSDVYKTINKLHIALVTSPIKKTNVILKNVNFQYALKLWNYMQENLNGKDKSEKHNKKYEDNGELKKYSDETFLLNYLIANELNGGKESKEIKKEEIDDKLVENMLNQLLNYDAEMTLEALKDLVGKKFKLIKYRQVTTTKQIEEIFSKKIEAYFTKVENFKW